MHAAEVLIHEPKRHGSGMIFNLLRHQWSKRPLPCQFWGQQPKTLSSSSFSALSDPKKCSETA